MSGGPDPSMSSTIEWDQLFDNTASWVINLSIGVYLKNKMHR